MLGRVFRGARVLRATRLEGYIPPDQHHYFEHFIEEDAALFATLNQKFPKTSPHDNFNHKIPGVLANDRVMIFKHCANAMQNEYNDNSEWVVRSVIQDYEQTHWFLGREYGDTHFSWPTFKNIEDAIAYCDRTSLDYVIQEDHHRTYKHGKSYAANYRFKGLTPRKPFD